MPLPALSPLLNANLGQPGILRLMPPRLPAMALHGTQASRAIEASAQARLPPHTLMGHAGLACARLALALAPHAQNIWVACGPGNNGGDGLLAAMHLHQAGKQVQVTWLGSPERLPPDARDALAQAHAAGVPISPNWPRTELGPQDLAIDALLGLGVSRAPEGRIADAVEHINASHALVMAVDLPSGLDADTGWLDQPDSTRRCVRADHTLSLLTIKPGLFTAHGRDQAGCVWYCDLGASPLTTAAIATDAWLTSQADGLHALAQRHHAQHKGSFGNVAVIGGSPGMTGAALLAAQAALHQGAGRVYVQLLDGPGATPMGVLPSQPELMFRTAISVADIEAGDYTVVCGCGGGSAVHGALLPLLAHAPRLVLDADALNALAADANLLAQLRARATRGQHSIITPHPLEAARLLNVSTEVLQSNRPAHACRLAELTQAVVVLKGSGTVIASPVSYRASGLAGVWINPTGNARLGTAGTGDVLAGWIAALWAQGLSAMPAAISAVYEHGQQAELWPADSPLTASGLSLGCATALPSRA